MNREEATHYAKTALKYKGQTVEIINKRNISKTFTLIAVSKIHCEGESDETQKCKCSGTLQDKNGNTATYSVKKIVELFEKGTGEPNS